MRTFITASLFTVAVLLGAGCGDQTDSKPQKGLPDESNILRVVQPKSSMRGLPRGEDPGVREAALIRNFADDNGLTIKWSRVAPDKLATELIEGRSDVAIGCKLEWIPPDAKLLFTRPVFNPVRATADSSDMGITEEDPKTVWAVAKSSKKMLHALNEFLVASHPSITPAKRIGDLAEIKERGYIRVLTRNNPACYFIHRGELMGFEYELVKQFAKQEGLEVVMIVPPRWTDLKQWMLEGRGDMIAAAITVSDERKKSKELCFGHPYGNAQEIIVTRTSDDKLKQLSDLAGRTIHVRKTSHYWRSLEKLKNETGIDFTIEAAPETMETREILHRVESGDLDLTMADSGFLDIEINTGRKLRSAFMFKKTYKYGWVVSREHTELKTAIDRFFAKQIGTSGYNYLYGKYFRNVSVVEEFQDDVRSLDKAEISPYDKLIKKAAAKYQFHWCLIAAQMYQESRFKADAKSWSGARGLMQLMPATAGDLGLNERNIADPEKNIDAGVKYLGQQRKRVPDEVDDFNRLCFALASYNGGYGHLIDARDLAEKLGRDPNLWIENVDYAYSLLSTPKYADRAKYGYCRSDEIIGYVRKIMSRYFEYKSEIERLSKTAE